MQTWHAVGVGPRGSRRDEGVRISIDVKCIMCERLQAQCGGREVRDNRGREAQCLDIEMGRGRPCCVCQELQLGDVDGET